MKLKIKGKTGQKLCEDAKLIEKMSIFKTLFCSVLSSSFLMISVQKDPRNNK